MTGLIVIAMIDFYEKVASMVTLDSMTKMALLTNMTLMDAKAMQWI